MAYLGAALQHAGFLTLTEFSYVIAAGFLGMFVGTIIFGMGSDAFGRRTSFTLMLLIYSIFTLLGAFAADAWTLTVLRGLAGIGIGAELVVIDIYVTEIVPSRARGRYIAITQLVGFTAIPVVALLSKLLVPTEWWLEGWRWVMVIGGLGAVFVWYLRRRLPESPRWLESTGQPDRAEAIMRAIENEVEDELREPLPKPQVASAKTLAPAAVRAVAACVSRPYCNADGLPFASDHRNLWIRKLGPYLFTRAGQNTRTVLRVRFSHRPRQPRGTLVGRHHD